MTKYPEFEIPLGWNALLDNTKKTALIIGEYKVKGKARTTLTLINKPTKDELLSSIPEGFSLTYPKTK